MQNVQNAAEIQQRVINLVELYRRKAGWESQTAKDAKADRDFWEQESVDMMIEDGVTIGGFYGEGPHTEDWIKKLMVNEQLLGHFYAEVAGEDANKEILDELLPDVYDKTIFTEEEEAFLKSHLKEMVNYIIVTPNDDCLELVNRYDSRDAYVIPNEVLELIGNRTNIAKGSKIFYPYTGFGQFMNLYEGCKFYCDVKNAWMQVSAYANNADVEYADVEVFEGKGSYDAVVSYLVGLSDKGEDINYLCKAYESLKSGGKFILICPPRLLVEGSNPVLRKRLVEDQAIKEIIQLPQVMSNNASFDTYCVIIAEKNRKEQTTAFIDARGAHKDLDNKHYMLSFDIEAFNAIIENDGIDPRTDRCDVIMMSRSDLNERILLPQVFTIERPSEKDHPIPLSDVCTLETTSIRNITFDLPMDTPWVKESDLSYLFKGELDVAALEKADCPNNPPHTEDYAFDSDGEFSDHIFSQRTPIGRRVRKYRACTYVDGKSDLVLYKRTPEDGVCVALIRATGRPIAISEGISVFCPIDGFDALHLLALLRLPIVYRQILAYKDYGLRKFMDMILVPTCKIIIYDEIHRMDKERSILSEQEEKFSTMKTEYVNEVRMRKHDMRPHMVQLDSSKNLMQYYVDNMDTIDDVKQHLIHQITRFQNALSHLSNLIEHLSDEEQFGEAEQFSLTDYFCKIISESTCYGYDVIYSFDDEQIVKYLKNRMHESFEHLNTSFKSKDDKSLKGDYSILKHWSFKSYTMIAPFDFDRIVQNILENARKHGFTDSSRSDYKIWIILNVDEKRDMFVIDFKNNGTPLPDGMTKERYGLKGERAGITGGTGSGGYIVKSIVNHYGGDYDVFFNDGMTTIRIWLPIATI
jgi:signal transduction histidine kinase